MQEQETLLKIRNLSTSFRIAGKFYAAVDDVSLDIFKNEVFALVGESGCGKTALAMSITKLHNQLYTRMSGEVIFKERNVLALNNDQLQDIRGRNVGMIFQDALSALNPLMRVGYQIEETLYYHGSMSAADRKMRVLELFTEVGLPNPELAYTQYPHQLSGGMRQRVMIACALACKPDLIIADEPTTALDVTIQAQILDLLRKLQAEMQATIILITHDLGVVAEMADRVAVMYAGQIVEMASVWDLFGNPQHPYTRSLLASIPNLDVYTERLHVIKGMVPPLHLLPRSGCRFSARTPWLPSSVHQETPTYHEVAPGHIVLCTCYAHFVFEGEDFQTAKVEGR